MKKEQCIDKSEVVRAEAKWITQFATSTSKIKCLDDANSVKIKQELSYKLNIVWRNVIGMIILHLMAFYGFYLTFTSASIWTTIWGWFVAYLGAIGVTAGGHRLWSHRSYKATLPMRIFLMILQTIANEDSIYYWARDHRLHHKYTDTNADPYNSTRGFFYSHMGWFLVRKHPDVMKFGKELDLSDLTSDPVVVFQKKYFMIIMPIFNIIIPTLIPMYFWNESFKVAFFIAIWKWITCLHLVSCGNSVLHTWGYKPYDSSSTAMDNPYLTFLMVGEAWHNYHHAFPWVYTVPDIPFHYADPMAKMIEFFALFGLVYDLKTVSPDLAMKQANRRGDGTVQARSTIENHIDNYYFSQRSTI